MAAPIITVLSQDKTKISSITGHDQCIVTFSCDLNVDAWEARATLPGITPAIGVGTLVESGELLAANTPATVYVDDEELTNGDNEYTVTIHCHATNGYNSDGGYESTVVADFTNSFIDGWDYTLINNGVHLTCNPSNIDISNTKVSITGFNDWTPVSLIEETQQTGWITMEFEKLSTFNVLVFGILGDVRDAGIRMDASNLINGENYVATFNVDLLTLNDAELTDILILRKLV